MTVANANRRIQYAGNGVTTAFPVPFPFPAATDLRVTRTLADGSEQLLLLNLDYTVSGAGSPAGGTLTMAAAPATGQSLTIKRVIARTQLVDYVPNDPFPADTHEAALDKLTMIAQEDGDELARAILVPDTDPARGAMTIPPMPGRAGRFMGFDAMGRPVALSGTGNDADLRDDLADPIGSTLIGHSAAFTGAQPRDVRDRLRDQISLMDVLTPSERADVQAGIDPGTITARLNALIKNSPEGAILDASMLKGTIAIDAPALFAGIPTARKWLLTSNVTFLVDFSGGSMRLPSFFTWDCTGTTFRAAGKVAYFADEAVPGKGMIQTAFFGGVCSGAAASDLLTVDDTTGLHPNSLIAIQGIREDAAIEHQIAEAMTPSGPATLSLSPSGAATVANSIWYAKIDSEIVRLLVAPDGLSATVQQRGALGTTPASHSAGSTARWMTSAIFRVLAVNGTELTLNGTLPISFSGAVWRAGTVQTSIVGHGFFDGNFDQGDPASDVWSVVASALSNYFRLDGHFSIRRGMHGGLTLFGAANARIRLHEIRDCGRPADSLGASIWLFGPTVSADVQVHSLLNGYVGVILDNKTGSTTPFQLDASPTLNEVRIGRIFGHDWPYILSGATRNVVTIGFSSASNGGQLNDGEGQTTSPVHSSDNFVAEGRQAVFRAPTGADLALNTVLVGERGGRHLAAAVTVASTISLPAAGTAFVNFTLTGARTADLFQAQPQADLPDGIVMQVTRPASANTVRLCFINVTAASVDVTSGTQIDVTARGPW